MRLEMRKGRQRHLRAGIRLHVNIFQRFRALLKARRYFEHYVVLIELRENGGHLPLPERIV